MATRKPRKTVATVEQENPEVTPEVAPTPEPKPSKKERPRPKKFTIVTH